MATPYRSPYLTEVGPDGAQASDRGVYPPSDDEELLDPRYFSVSSVAVRTLFLTGGTGFVGSHVAREFLARGWQVRALVRRPDRPGLLPRGAEIVPGDLDRAAGRRQHLTGCTAVVHCAGATRARSLEEFRRLNVGGTEALVRAASAACPDAHVRARLLAGGGRPIAQRRAGARDRSSRSRLLVRPLEARGRGGGDASPSRARGAWCARRSSTVRAIRVCCPMFAIVARGVAPVVAGGRRRVQLLAAQDLARSSSRSRSGPIYMAGGRSPPATP